MDIIELKLFSKIYVNLQDNLNTEQKKELFNIIEKCNMNELQTLLLTGSTSGVITEELHQNVLEDLAELIPISKSSWKNGATSIFKSGYKSGKSAGFKQGIAATAVAASIIYTAIKLYTKYFSQAAKACKNQIGDAKVACINSFKIQALQSQMSRLSSGKSKCRMSKDSDKCAQKVNDRIKSIQTKLAKLKK